jgi:hypothetical protein
MEIIDYYYKKHIKPTNTPFEQNARFMNVGAGGIFVF